MKRARDLLSRPLTLFSVCLTVACAGQADHFYTLDTPRTAKRPVVLTQPLHVRLEVSLPSLVDRAEMVLSTSDNGILILDHERWAAPLADQVASTLGRDLEAQRGDILVSDRELGKSTGPLVIVKVDIVRMTASRGGPVVIEAHWRISEAELNVDSLNSDVFQRPVVGAGYAAVAHAYSQNLDELARRLAVGISQQSLSKPP